MLGVVVGGAVVTMVALANTLHRISENTVARTPDAILASAGVKEAEVVRLPVMYYDQRMDECVNIYEQSVKDAVEKRQFEWSECGYSNGQIEQGLVEHELDEQYLPVATGGNLLPNRGIDMARWYGVQDGKSMRYASTIGLKYYGDGAEFAYSEDKFYPLDDVDFSTGDVVNRDGHNHLFTMNFAVPFTVLGSGSEEFSIKADDDTFVYVDDRLVIDMGGIHDATVGRFVIRENGDLYAGVDGQNLAYSGVSVLVNEGAMVRIFHADRDSRTSVFELKFAGMDLSVVDTELADGNNGVQVAYDPSDPSYIPPLGESEVFRPDTTRGLVLLATIEGVAILVMAMVVVYTVRCIVKNRP